MSNQNSTSTKAILKAWLIAGTLDISCALLYYYIKSGNNPLDVLVTVSRFALGKEILTSEVLGNKPLMWALGLIVHYTIAFAWTILFFWSWPRVSFLQKDKIITGLAYGAFIWIVMNLAVIPMRAMRWPPYILQNILIGGVILMLAVGLPVSIIIGNYYSKRSAST